MIIKFPKKIVVYLAIFTCFSSVISARDITLKEIINTASDDFKYLVASPLRMTQKDGLKLLALSGLSAGLIFHFDQEIEDNLIENHRFKSPVLHSFSNIAKTYGASDHAVIYMFSGLSSSILAGGYLFNDNKMWDTGFLMVESFVYSQFITWFGKLALGRARPYAQKGSHDFNFFAFSVDDRSYRSMPSGHTTAVFALMTVLAKQYEQWWIKYPAYTFATAAAIQRVDSGHHWASDVLLGGCIAYFVADILVDNHKLKKTSQTSLKPYILSNEMGLSLYF